jgi:hypothetical protein
MIYDVIFPQRNHEMTPRRQKTFSTTLSSSLPTSLGTGSSALLFSPDSNVLVLATSLGSSIAIVNLPESKEEVFKVVKVFGTLERKNGKGRSGREIRGRSGKASSSDDVVMNGVDDENEDEEDDDDEEMGTSSLERSSSDIHTSTVTCLSISSDGHWLASADLERRVSVYDLKSYRVRIILFPSFDLRLTNDTLMSRRTVSHNSADFFTYSDCPLFPSFHFRFSSNSYNIPPYQRYIALLLKGTTLPPLDTSPVST